MSVNGDAVNTAVLYQHQHKIPFAAMSRYVEAIPSISVHLFKFFNVSFCELVERDPAVSGFAQRKWDKRSLYAI